MRDSWIQSRRISLVATVIFYGLWAVLKMTNLDNFQNGNNATLVKVSLAASICGLCSTALMSYCSYRIKKFKQ